MCLSIVACDPVRNISSQFHVTQLWPMAFHAFSTSAPMLWNRLPLRIPRQRSSLSLRVSWRRICLRSRTCITGGYKFPFFRTWTLSFNSCCIFRNWCQVSWKPSVNAFDCLQSLLGSPCFDVTACNSPVLFAFLLVLVVYLVISLPSCIWYVFLICI